MILSTTEDYVSILLYVISHTHTNTWTFLTCSGCFCGGFITSGGCCCVDFSLLVCGRTALLFPCTAAGLVQDFGADFLYMEVGFFPVPKKAAPTKILGLGFRLLKVIVIAFLDSVGLLVVAGAATVVDAGLAVTLLK